MRGPTLTLNRARPLLGTLVQIQASGPSELVGDAIDNAFSAIERVQQLMSYQDPRSELSALNQQALYAPRRVHADTYAVLFAALHFARLSEGAFDPCVGFDLEQWGLLPTDTLRRSRPCGGTWRDIELLPDQSVCFHRPVRVDLGGIAKGYAVDLAIRALIEGGVREGLVNAGGDLRVVGPVARRIALRHPLAPERLSESVRLCNEALATSGAYYSRQRRGGCEYSALVNPNGRSPHLDTDSVSVRAANCLSADALTKVVLFAPTAVAERALAACDATAFVQQPPADDSVVHPRHGSVSTAVAAHAH